MISQQRRFLLPRRSWRHAVAALLGALLWNALPPIQASANAPAVAERFREVGIFQRLGESLPLDTSFRDEAGRDVRLGDYFGQRPVLLMLVYYQCPMLCNVAFHGLLETMSSLDFDPGQDFELVIVSFDPGETPQLAAAKKRTFHRRYNRTGAERGTHFLTGDAESIRRLTEAVGFRYFYDEASKQFAHASGIMIATPQGTLARYFYGIEYPPKDVRWGLVEASAGRIGTPVDQILLLCFHYDPATGRYGFAIMSALRAAGVVTVLLIVGLIARSVVRERRTALTSAESSQRLSEFRGIGSGMAMGGD
jgi:protein SCO1/2